MKHVFISYKREDMDFADNLCHRLKDAGFPTWMDQHIRAGDEWRAQIDRAISGAFAFIVIMTPEARASEYVTYEWAYAYGLGLRVIPLKYRETSLHPRLSALQFLDFTNHTTRPWERLIAEVRDAAEAASALAQQAVQAHALTAIQQARAALNSPNPGVRKDAITTLAQANDAEAHQALMEALSHSIAQVRQEAIIALGHIHYQSATPRLIEMLHDPNADVRLSTICALGHMGDAAAVSSLLQCVESADEKEKLRIIEVLPTFHESAVVPVLLTLYKQTGVELRRAIITTLGMLRDKAALPLLEEALHDSDADIRGSTAVALLRIGRRKALDLLTRELIKVNEPRCKVLLDTMSQENLNPLIVTWGELYQRCLNPQSPGDSDIESDLPPTQLPSPDVLASSSLVIRRRIMWMLGYLKSHDGVPILIQAIDDPDKEVLYETVRAMKAIADQRFLPPLMTLLRRRSADEGQATTILILQALGLIGNARIVNVLNGFLQMTLKAGAGELALQAIATLGKVGDYDSISYLRSTQSYLRAVSYSHTTKLEISSAIDAAIKEIRTRLME